MAIATLTSSNTLDVPLEVEVADGIRKPLTEVSKCELTAVLDRLTATTYNLHAVMRLLVNTRSERVSDVLSMD